MTDDRSLDHLPLEPELSQQDQTADPVATLLQRALAQPPEPRVQFLPGVQERIRMRTRGRYYGGRRAIYRSPVVALLLAATLILLMGALAFLVFEGLSGEHPPNQRPPSVKSTSSSK